MSLILFCLLFAAGMGIAHRYEVAGKTFPENVKARKTAFWLMLFIQIPFWLLCISGETEQLGSVAAKYGWHTQPAVIAAFLFLAELAIFFWACQNVCFPEKDGEWIIRLGICSVGAPRFLQYVHTEYFWKRRTERCLPWARIFQFCLQYLSGNAIYA